MLEFSFVFPVAVYGIPKYNDNKRNGSGERKSDLKKKIICSGILIVLFGALLSGAGGEKTREKGTDAESVRHYTAFFDVEGQALGADNEIKKEIAKLTGAECEEIWLTAQTQEDALNSYVATGEYPDFISGTRELYEEEALIPLDDYLDNYPNLKKYADTIGRDRLRLEDGHIYWLPQFGVVNGEESEVLHQGEAFWIQTRVLKWAGYPEITTLDQYFDLLERYIEANPVMENGTENIAYTILCDDWRYFCLENPPQFLDGYPNDGCCMVDSDTLTVIDYNITPTAKRYFQKLNEEYKKGIIDPESFTSSYEQYLEKLSSGAVLGMVDQWWNFTYDISKTVDGKSFWELGCNYVPLPITIEEGIQNKWHVKRSNELDISSGISITVSCTDVEGALQFLNDLLEPEVQRLRFWGIEGEDYEIDEEGILYRTYEQREKVSDSKIQESHFCIYSYFPRFEGMEEGSKNTFSPEYQPGEFFDSLTQDIRDCFEAYGCKTYVDMLGTNEQPGAWYPMYSYSAMLTYATEPGRVWKKMEETKHLWLPQVIMSEDFEKSWQEYMAAYEACNPELFFADLQQELNRRMGITE